MSIILILKQKIDEIKRDAEELDNLKKMADTLRDIRTSLLAPEIMWFD